MGFSQGVIDTLSFPAAIPMALTDSIGGGAETITGAVFAPTAVRKDHRPPFHLNMDNGVTLATSDDVAGLIDAGVRLSSPMDILYHGKKIARLSRKTGETRSQTTARVLLEAIAGARNRDEELAAYRARVEATAAAGVR